MTSRTRSRSRWSASYTSAVVLAVVATLLSSCGGGSGCERVGPSLLDQLNNGMRGFGQLSEAFAVESSEFGGVWLIGADVGDRVAVWSTNITPAANEAGLILVANEAAAAVSDLGVDVPTGSPDPVAQARFDDAAIEEVTACAQG